MRLSEMTKKQLLKSVYSRHKSIATCGSCGLVEIPRLIFENDGSITLLFKCRQ